MSDSIQYTSEAESQLGSDESRSSDMRSRWKSAMRRKLKQSLSSKISEGLTVDTSHHRMRRKHSRDRAIFNMDNAPLIVSPYDDKMKRLLQSNPPLLNNRVHIPWYRRYTEVIPDKDQQIGFQPFREIQNRDEDIALQHQYGTHECMQDYVTRGLCRLSTLECKRVRELAMARYIRIKKREEEKRERDAPPPEDTVFTVPGQDIDLTTEFGFSANKKKIVCPVVDFLMKLHMVRERNIVRRSLPPSSKWHLLRSEIIKEMIHAAVREMKRQAARSRIRRLFNIVLCVDRFIKCVAMIAGDTQTLLKDTTYRSMTRLPVVTPTEDKPERELAFFNLHNYKKVGQVQVPFHIQLILSKPWFCRSNKEVDTAVRFLEKMRCFTAYPKQFQFMLARVAWYIELPTQKVVIRQSQQAVNFYLLLNGSVRIDVLEGSPYELDGGVFRTVDLLSSQDMFGDECVTQPLAERKYTATTEEKCAVLDFNMHDYNNMIQTANTSEEAPDHIRFLCKLRIMDHFPKIKLLREQDTNVTYFFFRPGTVVCKSVRNSPFVFVIRNGSCSILHEIKPKWDYRKFSRQSKNFAGPLLQITGSREKQNVKSSFVNMNSIRRSRAERKSMTRKQPDIYQGIQNRLSEEDKQWFEKTRHAFEKSKASVKDQARTLRSKTETLTRTMSADVLERSNLDNKLETLKKSDEGLGRVSRSSLRWNLDGNLLPVENADESEDATEENPSREPSVLGSARPSILKLPYLEPVRRKSKIVGTNIPLTLEKLVGESVSCSSIWNENINNSARDRAPSSSLQMPKSLRVPVHREARKSSNPPDVKLAPSRNLRLSREHSHLLRQSFQVPVEQEPPQSKYSQWSEKALLTVTDVVGVEWLDYNDGTYKPPSEDVSLVSHGATIIMIKKDFLLKYLRKAW